MGIARWAKSPISFICPTFNGLTILLLIPKHIVKSLSPCCDSRDSSSSCHILIIAK